MANTKEVLSFAVELGDIMLRNGAEVYRVEDSVLAVLDSYKIKDYDVYVLSNGIFASAEETTDHGCSFIRHVPMLPMHLARISALNGLCREVCAHTITLDEAWEKLLEYKKIPSFSFPTLMLATGIGCGGFAYLYGGTPLDAIMAIVVGIILRIFLNYWSKYNSSKTITNVLGSAIVTIFSVLVFALGMPVHYDKIIIGGIMPLVPGIPLTNSIRDFINSDYLSGSIRLIDALLTAFCIAVGVGIIITIAHLIGGGIII
ncbi:MAG: threonine/serine exporter family protein [Pseudobutyrivibrio sp.]|nr:threonine/serine exporter family protein [Pseudobutyrivibrio sp.]